MFFVAAVRRTQSRRLERPLFLNFYVYGQPSTNECLYFIYATKKISAYTHVKITRSVNPPLDFPGSCNARSHASMIIVVSQRLRAEAKQDNSNVPIKVSKYRSGAKTFTIS